TVYVCSRARELAPPRMRGAAPPRAARCSRPPLAVFPTIPPAPRRDSLSLHDALPISLVAAQCFQHRVAYDRLRVGCCLLERGAGRRCIDLPEGECGARAQLRRRTREQLPAVEQAVQHVDVVGGGDRTEGFEEGHLLGEIRVADQLAVERLLEPLSGRRIAQAGEPPQRNQANLTILVVDRMLQGVERRSVADADERLDRRAACGR